MLRFWTNYMIDLVDARKSSSSEKGGKVSLGTRGNKRT